MSQPIASGAGRCLICGATCPVWRHIKTAEGPTISVAACRACSHAFQHPRADKSFAESFYSENYAAGTKLAYFNPEYKLKHAEDLYKAFHEKCPDAPSVIEIGGGLGAFSRVLIDHGHQVATTEMSATAVERAKELFGVEMHLGTLETLPKSAPVDAIIMWDVIEHCPDPDQVLAAATARLRPGGMLLLTTGNYESEGRFAGGDEWWCWAADHYHYFSPGSLRKLGERFGLTGFAIDRVVRLVVPSGSNGQAPRPSPTRFLNPFHVARSINGRVRRLIASLKWPDHWDIGVMLATFRKA